MIKRVISWCMSGRIDTGFMMEKLSPQLPLGLSKDEATFANYYAGKNAQILEDLKFAASGHGERIIYLYGAHGLGCSHLLQAACQYAHQQRMQSVYLPLAELHQLSPELLSGLESFALVCIDDLQHIAGMKEWEEALFHLFNHIRDAGGRMIFAANDVPQALGLTLPDLVSRLSWGIVYELQPLSDQEKLSVFSMRANKRGMHLPDEVGKYILTHYSRHMGALFAALDMLDIASLAAQRRLTIPFVKRVLEI